MRDLVIEPNESVDGRSYAEWSVKWWNWALSIPKDKNPLLDKSGEYCGMSQEDPVWFLAWSWGGGERLLRRMCDVPHKKRILVPVLPILEYATEYQTTNADLKQRCEAKVGKATSVKVSLDGSQLECYRIQSYPFNLTLPLHNMVVAEGGTYNALSDGYWTILQSPSPEKHALDFSANTGDFGISIHYDLNIILEGQAGEAASILLPQIRSKINELARSRPFRVDDMEHVEEAIIDSLDNPKTERVIREKGVKHELITKNVDELISTVESVAKEHRHDKITKTDIQDAINILRTRGSWWPFCE